MTVGVSNTKFSIIASELNGSSPISLSQYYRTNANIPANTITASTISSSGTITVGSLRGLTRESWIVNMDYSASASKTNFVNGVTVGPGENFYTAGYSNGRGSNEGIICKFDKSGSLQVETVLTSSTLNAIAVDSSDNIYVTGQTGTSVLIAKLASVTSSISAYGQATWPKTIYSHSLTWQKTLTSGTSNGKGIALDSSNNVYVVADTVVTVNKISILKYNSSGILQWQKYLDYGTASTAYGITVDSSNNIYVTGALNSSGNPQLYLGKFDSSGNLTWQVYLANGSTDYAEGRSVSTDKYGNVYVLGRRKDPSYNYKIIVSKFNSTGVLVWSRQNESSTTAGNQYYSGEITTNVDGDTYLTLQSKDNTYYETTAYTGSGDLLWTRRFTIQSPYSSYFGQKSPIKITSNNNLILASNYLDSANTYVASIISKIPSANSSSVELGLVNKNNSLVSYTSATNVGANVEVTPPSASLSTTISTLSGTDATPSLTVNTSNVSSQLFTLNESKATVYTGKNSTVQPGTFPSDDIGIWDTFFYNGDTYHLGYKYGSNLPSVGRALILFKMNSSGICVWNRQVTISSRTMTPGNTLFVNSTGIYFAGYAFNSTGFNIGFLMCYSLAGVIQWQRQFQKANDVSVQALTVNGTSIYISGLNSNTYSFLMKYNTSGTYQWSKYWYDSAGVSPINYSFSGTTSLSLTTDSSGYVYVLNRKVGSPTGPTIIKVDSAGTVQWYRTITGLATAVAIGSDGTNIFVMTLANSTDYNFFKINSSGTLQWQKTLSNSKGYPNGSGRSNRIYVDSAGSMYAAYLAYNSTSSTAGSGLTVFKLNSSGTPQSATQIGSMFAGDFADACGFAIDETNNTVYTAGRVPSFYNTTNGNASVTYLIAKYKQDVSFSSAVNIVNENLFLGPLQPDGGPITSAAGFIQFKECLSAFTVSTGTYSLNTPTTMSLNSDSMTDAAGGYTDAVGTLWYTSATTY